MNIQETKEMELTIIKNNFKQLQVLCSKVFKIAPQSNMVLMARDVAKYISCIGLGVNPAIIDINTDTVINEFFQQTKLLTDFTKLKTSSIYSFCTGNNQTLKACFYVYFIKRIESMKSYDSLFYYAMDGETPKKKGGFFAGIFAALKGFAKSTYEQAKQDATDKAIEKGTQAIEDFGTWLANETGIGRGEGNARNSGGKIYYVWKFFPSGPLAYLDKPIKEDISANYKKEWVKIIENGSKGLSFDEVQYYFERLFPKIKAGYYKDQNEMVDDMIRIKQTEQNAALNKIVKKENAKGFLSLLFKK